MHAEAKKLSTQYHRMGRKLGIMKVKIASPAGGVPEIEIEDGIGRWDDGMVRCR
jgi:hypothetical protein